MNRLLFFFIVILIPGAVFSQGLKSFITQNGLTVFVWEDTTMTEIFGMVSVKAGSINDPDNYTGLAHYLEHLMFKGTDFIGALEWHKEDSVYNAIIEKYNERSSTNDNEKRRLIDLQINELTVQQSLISKSDEFMMLIEGIGGTDLNAGTSFDYTTYYNTFPKSQLLKWLELYSTRFINPVFRGFQNELETVYEEYNMYQDNQNVKLQNLLFGQAFQGTPYSRPIIGIGEHLKNPNMAELIHFYDNYYVPENMALILVGDIKTEEVTGIINKKFSRIPVRSYQHTSYSPNTFDKGRQKVSMVGGYVPQVVLVYNGVSRGDNDSHVLDVALQLLTNSNKTGLLDKLSLEGDLMLSSATQSSFRYNGKIFINAIPAYDYSQGRFEAQKHVEKLLADQIEKLINEEYETWLLESVKKNMIRTFNRQLETSKGKAQILSQVFTNELGLDNIFQYSQLIDNVNSTDVKRVVEKYITNNYLAIYVDEGKVEDTDIFVKKPDLPNKLSYPEKKKSMYSHYIDRIHATDTSFNPFSFDQIEEKNINEKSKLFYYQNPENDIFTMTIQYNIGELDIPELDMAVQLMNGAGIMAALEPQEFRNELSKLNAKITYTSDDNHVYVLVEGLEDNLPLICKLMTRQILMPEIDEKQVSSIKGQAYQSQIIEREDLDYQFDALREYILYGQKSKYINRLDDEEIFNLILSDLIGAFQKATDYNAQIHYVGKLPCDEVHDILSTNLPLKKTEKLNNNQKSRSLRSYSENTVFFIANRDITQSRIFFFCPGDTFTPEYAPAIYAFNHYFGGGFNGLVMKEIRGISSMAYHAEGKFTIPDYAGNSFYFEGFVGTQADKTINAVDKYMNLLRQMPAQEHRMDEIKEHITLSLEANQPNFRRLSMYYEDMVNQGYAQPLGNVVIPVVQEMEFSDLLDFYEKQLKNKPIAIGIIGNPKEINLDLLKAFGKLERVSLNNIIN